MHDVDALGHRLAQQAAAVEAIPDGGGNGGAVDGGDAGGATSGEGIATCLRRCFLLRDDEVDGTGGDGACLREVEHILVEQIDLTKRHLLATLGSYLQQIGGGATLRLGGHRGGAEIIALQLLAQQ